MPEKKKTNPTKEQQGIDSPNDFFKGGGKKFPKMPPKKKKSKPKKAPPGTKIGPGRKGKKGNPHGVDDGTIYLKDGGSASKFGMLSVKAGIDNNPNPTQADRIAGATKKMKRGGKVTGRSIGPAGASIVSDDGKKIKQIKKISKSLLPLDAASVGAVSAIKGLGKLAGRLATRGYGKARK